MAESIKDALRNVIEGSEIKSVYHEDKKAGKKEENKAYLE